MTRPLADASKVEWRAYAAELETKIAALEKSFDDNFDVVLEVIKFARSKRPKTVIRSDATLWGVPIVWDTSVAPNVAELRLDGELVGAVVNIGSALSREEMARTGDWASNARRVYDETRRVIDRVQSKHYRHVSEIAIQPPKRDSDESDRLDS